jgi:hypothetical protein
MESTLPMLNMRYLLFLRKTGIKPKYFYDIGSSNQCWSKVLQTIFPDVICYTFDAYKPYNAQFPICLSNRDNDAITFYNHNEHIKSYYLLTEQKSEDKELLYTIKLDTFVKEQSLESPDIVKINCCGAEKDIIEGLHSSEYSWIKCSIDYTIENNGTIDDLSDLFQIFYELPC